MPVRNHHVLDNPVWHALGERQSALGDPGSGLLARRYLADVSPFAALPDEPTPQMWDALHDLVGPGGPAILFRAVVEEPASWRRVGSIPCHQMVPAKPFDAPEVEVVLLGPDDVDDMLALVARTQPGPFERRTIDMGTYLGIREDRDLVAMGGERMRPPGYTEMSAICTHPDHQRRGLAAAVMRALLDRIEARGERAFLHVAAENTGAFAAYERLGFTVRREVDVAILVAPA